jgi:xanthine dehydrogenase YagS FAD-binding subunit
VNPFVYERAHDVEHACASGQDKDTRFLGGGTNLIDLMKQGVERPLRLVDVSRLPLEKITALPDGGVRLGAAARNTDTANHELIRTRYPLLTQAIVAGASQQLRNLATNGGNLLQRTRCYYFYETAFPSCNKRNPGSGCGAQEGRNRIHAILGASEHCIATHPSDMAVALAALDAVVRVRGADGERVMPLGDFYRLPGDTPQMDTNLRHGELITAIDLPASSYAAHSHYLKVRDRASYAFALVSVAAALHLQDGIVRSIRIALGGVAHKPWRALEAERMLEGRALDDATRAAAAKAAVADARPQKDNAFKVTLAQRAIVRAVRIAAGVAT